MSDGDIKYLKKWVTRLTEWDSKKPFHEFVQKIRKQLSISSKEFSYKIDATLSLFGIDPKDYQRVEDKKKLALKVFKKYTDKLRSDLKKPVIFNPLATKMIHICIIRHQRVIKNSVFAQTARSFL